VSASNVEAHHDAVTAIVRLKRNIFYRAAAVPDDRKGRRALSIRNAVTED
jgi:hypothetical protein